MIVLALVIIALALGLTMSDARGAGRPLTFGNVCSGYTISKRGDSTVLIRCPGDPLDRPWMTIERCRNPRVTRTGDMLTIRCEWTSTSPATP